MAAADSYLYDDGILQINASGVGLLKYSVNQSPWTTNNLFNLPLGKHNVRVKDIVDTYSEDIMLYELEPIKYNDSFTITYIPSANKWESFHSFNPNYMFSTLKDMWSIYQPLDTAKLYTHGDGGRGDFYDEQHPSYIDVTFPQEESVRYDAVQWKSDVFDDARIPVYQRTFDYITIKDTYRSSGKLSINAEDDLEIYDGEVANIRHNWPGWSFNEFKNLGKRGKRHHRTIIDDYMPILENYGIPDEEDRHEFHGTHLTVRLEMDNLSNYTFNLYDIAVKVHNQKR